MTVVNVGGRIVWGHPSKAQKKTDNNGQPIFKDGQPVLVWAFGLAVQKAEALAKVWPAMHLEMLQGFPNGQFPPGIAWKYKDGDGIDDKGKPFADRTGYAGCWVLTISSEYQSPQIVRYDTTSRRYVDFADIKTGDFAEVNIDIKYHGANPKAAGSKPGLYLNPNGVLFLGYGDAIVSGPDADAMFGDGQRALPPGASAVPVASSSAPAPAFPMNGPPSAPGAVPLPPGSAAPPPPSYPVTASPSSPPPARDFVTAVAPSAMPPPPPANAMPPASPPSPPAVDPNAPVIVRYDPASGKPVWRWPDGREAMGN